MWAMIEKLRMFFKDLAVTGNPSSYRRGLRSGFGGADDHEVEARASEEEATAPAGTIAAVQAQEPVHQDPQRLHHRVPRRLRVGTGDEQRDLAVHDDEA